MLAFSFDSFILAELEVLEKRGRKKFSFKKESKQEEVICARKSS